MVSATPTIVIRLNGAAHLSSAADAILVACCEGPKGQIHEGNSWRLDQRRLRDCVPK